MAKYRKLVPALALICALADGNSAVGPEDLQRALAWSDYLHSHAARAFAAGATAATDGAVALLAKIRVVSGFSARSIYLNGWTNLASAEAVTAAAEMLCDLNHPQRIEKKPGVTGGRPSVTYEINPLTRPEGH